MVDLGVLVMGAVLLFLFLAGAMGLGGYLAHVLVIASQRRRDEGRHERYYMPPPLTDAERAALSAYLEEHR